MKVTARSTFPKEIPGVIFVLDPKTTGKHPAIASCTKEELSFVAPILREVRKRPGGAHVVRLPSERELLIFVGIRAPLTHRRAIIAVRHAIEVARKEGVRRLALSLDDISARGTDPMEAAETVAAQAHLANYEFTGYRTPPPEGWQFLSELVVSGRGGSRLQRALDYGAVVGEETNAARSLSNVPGGEMTPAALAVAARKAAQGLRIKVTVLDEPQIRKLKMGGVLGVSKGSSERPKFIVMEYWGGPKNEQPVVLAGKGVTFDSGGLNLKPSDGIYEMHMDMSGGASVIHALAALARLKTKKNIVALIPAVENMPSGSSYRPGDLLRSMSGKTIEVLNTDAEGRVILADALEFAKRYKPRLVIDLATLTGAAMVALGKRASALFSTDRRIARALEESGEATGDFVWPLPLWEEYEAEVKGTFGDVQNIGRYDRARLGGAIVGAAFLWQFMKEYPWVHLDIAPRMTAVEDEHLAKGSAGPGVQLLVHFLRKF